MKLIQLLCLSTFLFFTSNSFSQTSSELKTALHGFKFRSIGPAFMSGRIADLAIDPTNENIWYAAVGSGGVWKTTNAGTTWFPLTEKQPFYSTGCITLDPQNNSSIWLGTGENVGGRHVGIGKGIYHSVDGGKTWTEKGLKQSEHISKIIVHPTNSNIVWVAAQGPLWSKGGERGLFKTTDGGKTWKNTLEINEWTGVTDIVIDPTNPNILYAATWQRHRNVAVYMGGGPGTSLFKSIDGGESWIKIDNGIPKSNKGKIGLAISPIKPNVLYAAVELELRKGAVYRSENSGGSWTKMSETVSGGTGPHYYQELVASPHEFDKIFLMNVRMLISENGGKTFYTMSEKSKHSDNHALAFKKNDPNYLLVGTDGGIYESFDNTKNWKFVGNLPITQFYKLALDDTQPFYNIYGGTQDNNTQMGPSRTFKSEGISNSDWEVVLRGDGHQPATEPGNPNIAYAQWQQGNLNRLDRTNGERVYIQPHAKAGEPTLRFNWDAPIIVSQHDPKRIYFASQKVHRSDNRGDSWKSISSDLTKNQERLALPVMGKVQSYNNAWDVYAMSTYNTITSLAESKTNENVLYAGTDDGLIQTTKNGGKSWSKISVDNLSGVPSTAFVNDIKVDLFDENIAYVALDNHKFGDYAPYLYKTSDGGKTWSKITVGIPDNTMIWRIVQDHKNKNILFIGTEYGVYLTLDQGKSWNKFSNGLPTIPVRDLAIQQRESDLVLATFGRGMYILDDYSALRKISEETLKEEAILFEPRKALLYHQVSSNSWSSGGQTYRADNPPYGAVITYYIKKGFISKASLRKKAELSDKLDYSLIEKLSEAGYTTPESIVNEKVKKLEKATNIEKEKLEEVIEILKKSKGTPNQFPGWTALDDELTEQKPNILLEIKNRKGQTVAQVQGEYKKGLNTLVWDLTSKKAISTKVNTGKNYQDITSNVPAGNYSLTLYKNESGILTKLGQTQNLVVKQIRKGTLTNPLAKEHAAYFDKLAELTKAISISTHEFGKANAKLKTYQKNLTYVTQEREKLTKKVYELIEQMNELQLDLYGSEAKKKIGEKTNPSLESYLWRARGSNNSYGPTQLHMENYDIAYTLFGKIAPKLSFYIEEIEKLGPLFEKNGAPLILE